MTDTQFLRDQLAAARSAAEQAKLPNVRQRYLQSASVWAKLADQAERIEQLSLLPSNPGW